MNIDRILDTLNRCNVDYLLIGGVNYLLHHKPVLTYDVDIWVADNESNLALLNGALRELGAAWGPTEQQWAPVPADPSWLRRQECFCLTTEHGALDIFREVRGLEGRYDECRTAARAGTLPTGIAYRGLSDGHMLESQQALDEPQRDQDRIETLLQAIANERKLRQHFSTMAVQKSLKEVEEEKRERASDPRKRWRQIQEAITWAEANMKSEFRRNRPRVRSLPASLKPK